MLPKRTDARYLALVESGELMPLEDVHMTEVQSRNGTHGLHMPTRVLMYVKLPERKRRAEDEQLALPLNEYERLNGVSQPRIGEQLQLLGVVDQQVLTAKVHAAFFERRRRMGYVILDNVTWWGTISNPSDFGQIK